MKRWGFKSAAIMLALLAAAGCARGDAGTPARGRWTVDIERLIRELTDMDRLASLQNPGYEVKVESRDAGTETRTMSGEDGEPEYVVAALAGPGALAQLWFENPEAAGILRVHLDGIEHEPIKAVEMPAADWLGGKTPPAVTPLAGPSHAGAVSWFPIPFAESCMITTSAPPGKCQVIWRDYADGASVASWDGRLTKGIRQASAEAAAIIAGEAAVKIENLDWRREVKQWLPPGSKAGMSVFGRGAVRELKIRLEARDLDQALRDCLLEIRFDQQTEPAVHAPLGDFYSMMPDRIGFAALPLEIDGDGWMTCRWAMPFGRRVELEVRNGGAGGAGIEIEMAGGFRPWDEDALYFHAGDRAARPPEAIIELDPFIDSLIPVRSETVQPNFGWWYEKQIAE